MWSSAVGLGSDVMRRRSWRVTTPQKRRDEFAEVGNTDDPEDRMISRMRCVLALASLVIAYVDPSQIARPVALLYLSLVGFCVYSALLYVDAGARAGLTKAIAASTPWADLAWFTLLIALSSPTESGFFFGYFFAISNASFRWGFRSGLLLTISSLLLFSAVAYLAPSTTPPQLGRTLFRPTYLVIFGYLIWYWGGFHVSLTQRLQLLKEVTALSNPRFGIERTVATVMRRIRAFFEAETCVLLTAVSARDTCGVWRCSKENPDGECESQIPLTSLTDLLSLKPSEAIVYTRGWPPIRALSGLPDTDASNQQLRQIAETLNARCFMSVPWTQPGRGDGRLYLTSNRPYRFEHSDVEFLTHVIDQVMPTIENVRLVDQLATDAAETERQRIARDLHDSVVQPYIGLRMGLTAIRQKLQAQQNVLADVDHLSHVISLEIDDLRHYLRGLKVPSTPRGVFVEALSRFADRFSDATGIAVDLDVAENLQLNDRLAAEVFQLIAEAVSNARRHTESDQIRLRVRRQPQLLIVEVEDLGTADRTPQEFAPRSISERVAALGGHVHVQSTDQGGSIVRIQIPL